MTPEETKNYIEQRLRESGWGARIGGTTYEKVFRFTDGTEAGAKQVCYKLLALSSLLPDREVTDDLVDMALDGLTGVDDILKRSSRAAAAHQDGPGLDRDSIAQLAAVLDAKVATGELPKEIAPAPSKLATAKVSATPARAKPASGRPSPAKASAPPARSVPMGNGAAHSQATKASAGKNDTVFVSKTDRLVPEPRPTTRLAQPPRNSLLERLYQLSSTTTITLSATVLVVITLTMILYINHNAPDAPVVAQRDVGKVAPLPALPQRAGAAVMPEPTPVPLLDRREPAVAKDSVPSRTVVEATSRSAATSRTNSTSAAPTSTTSAKTASAPAAKPSPVADVAATGATPVPPAVVARTGTAASAPTVTSGAVAPTVVAKPTAQTAAAAPLTPTSVTPANRPKISREELTGLLRRFAYVYEAGDVTQFVNLFAENARTNDQSSRQGIRTDYEQFFRSTDLRQFNLGTVNWEVDENQAQGWGNFDVTVRRQGEQETQTYAGSLSFQVEKVDGRLRIVRLYHGQRRAGL
jgi:hypothetical protein